MNDTLIKFRVAETTDIILEDLKKKAAAEGLSICDLAWRDIREIVTCDLASLAADVAEILRLDISK